MRAERVWVETFTGLRLDQFGRLLKAVRERGGEGCAGDGLGEVGLRGFSPPALPLAPCRLECAAVEREQPAPGSLPDRFQDR